MDDHTVMEPEVLMMRAADVTPAPLFGVPVLVAEIASPSSQRIDRTLKHDAYARADVPQYRVVDPRNEDTAPWVDVYNLHYSAYRRKA